MTDEASRSSPKADISFELVPNDKCVQTDFTEKKNYTIVQFKAYQIRQNKLALRCEICLKKFKNSTDLKQHNETVHSKKLVKIKHPCKLCEKEFSRSDTLKNHIRKMHADVSYPVTDKPENALSSNQQQANIETNTTDNNVSKGDDEYKSDVNDFGDSNSDSDPNYEATTSTKNRKTSADCNVNSEQKTKIPESKAINFKYKCKDCGKTFHRSYNLRRHVIIHLEKRPFNCEYCERGFNRIDLLRRHVVGCYLSTDEGKQRCGRKISKELLDELDQRVRKQAKPCNRFLSKINNKSKKKKSVKNERASKNVSNDLNEKIECIESDDDCGFNDNANYENIDIDDSSDNSDVDDDDENKNVIDLEQAVCFVDVAMDEVDTPIQKNVVPLFSSIIKSETREIKQDLKPVIKEYISSDDSSDLNYENGQDHENNDDEEESDESILSEKLKNKDSKSTTHVQNEGSAFADYKCTQCDKTFTRERNLRRHAIVHSETRPFNCDFCQKGYNRYDNLRQHIVSCYLSTEEGKSRYGTERPPELMEELEQRIRKQGKTYDCQICGDSFNAYKQLIEHRKVHTKAKPYECSECDASFKRPFDLRVHIRMHTGERPFKCQYCGKGFKTATNVRCHERRHTGEKPHLCTICGKGYTKGYNLSIHMKTHTGEDQSQCSICLKKFNRPNDLKEHMRAHTGDFLKCELCGRNFIRNTHLKRHKLKKHGIMMNLDEPENLKVQAPAETENLLSCDICGRNYTRNYHLKHHKQVKHGIPMKMKKDSTEQNTEVEDLGDFKDFDIKVLE